ncbi:hypothetical protein [Mycobacterium sp. OTB74]|uniref:hypothetical protein n=1 Tax=Mycobacterium sp. OTB74 TaxID=1853452 RepID=UPI00247530BC|nr:hypothetical protein [Mycobacterium sp. OTB74]
MGILRAQGLGLSSAEGARIDMSKGTLMTVHARRSTKREKRAHHYRLAAMAVGVGIAAASGQHVAWADTGHNDSSNASSSLSSTGNGPTGKTGLHKGLTSRPSSGAASTSGNGASASTGTPAPKPKPIRQPATTGAADSTSDPNTLKSNSLAQQLNSLFGKTRDDSSGSASKKSALGAAAASAPSPVPSVAPSSTSIGKRATLKAALLAAVTASSTQATTASSTETTTTDPAKPKTPSPQPLSPIAKLAELPGRIINTVLETLDLTVAATGPTSPFNWAPVSEALFAAFRRWETSMGLDKTPTAQPTPATITYAGDTSQKTPTVAQFLDAATAEYVLGGQPSDLKPFVVNGFQMQSTNILSGESAKAWVTPEGQIIIAYQGTTGGTNLLVDPLIAITQSIADAQVIFTNTTPQAFVDSLTFAQQVQAEAAKQGYNTDDIFVTGQSLGGWEAQYVAQQTGLDGIGFEGPGLNTTVPGNGVNSGFVNVETYGDVAAYLSTDLPGLQPFMPAYVAGGGTKPHYGSIVMIGDPNAVDPLINGSALWGPNVFDDLTFAGDLLGNFLEHHMPGMQAYSLGVTPDPGVLPWLGSPMGPVNDWGDLTIPELQQAASDAGVLIAP